LCLKECLREIPALPEAALCMHTGGKSVQAAPYGAACLFFVRGLPDCTCVRFITRVQALYADVRAQIMLFFRLLPATG
jgi:hypothetical protein